MKKEVTIHFVFLIAFLILVSVLKGWIETTYWPFWLGMVLGTILPDLDHLVYVYFLEPNDLTSQRVTYSISKKEIFKSAALLYDTRRERVKLIFHTAWFQILFLILAIFVSTSSASVIGFGIVLAFSIHLLVDQLLDLIDTKNLDSWFKGFLIIQMNIKRYWAYFAIASLLTIFCLIVF